MTSCGTCLPRLSALAAVWSVVAVLSLGEWSTFPVPLRAQSLPSLAEPGIAPDGSTIAFTSAGDIWTVPATGGAARLLVAHSAHESRPLYSPDGRHLAFNSNRTGADDVYVMELGTGEVRRLTHDSGSEQLTGWSRDGAWVYFTSNVEDVSGMHDVYRVRVEGGTPMAVAADRYEGEFFAAPSPRTGLLAIATRGRMAQSQWWRNGHSHIDESEIWLVEEAAGTGDVARYRPVAEGGKNLWPMWGPEADRVYFMSDRSGAENLWSAPVDGGRAERLTDFDDGRVLWPSMSADGRTVAFERDFDIWTHDIASGATRPLDVQLIGSVEGPTAESEVVDDGWSDITVSPDGEKWAFTRGGDVFASTMEGGVEATRVTRTPAAEQNLVWAPDSRQILYTSWRTGTPRIYAYDFVSETERAVTEGAGREQLGDFSPGGERFFYARLVDEETELRVRDWPDGQDRRLAIDVAGTATWSPDGQWIAYGAETDEFTNVMVVPAEGGEPRQVSFLANSFFGSLDWSPTGDFLVYRSAQRTEPGRIVKVDLVPLAPTFDEDAFRDLFNEPSENEDDSAEERTPTEGSQEAVTPPAEVEIVFDGIRRRGAFVDTDFSAGSIRLSPDGETGIVSGDGALHRINFGPNGDIDIEPLEIRGSLVGFDASGRNLYIARNGKLHVHPAFGGSGRTVEATAEIADDFEGTREAAFEQGWGEMRDGFYDAGFHGADWTAVRDRFRPYVTGSRTRAEFSRVMNLMLGELNASHLGHRGRTGPPQGGDGVETGRLGLRFDRHAYENEGRFVVSEVLALGPADVAGGIAPGDRIVHIGGQPLDGGSDLPRLLANTVGERALIGAQSGGGPVREVEVLATSPGAERQLVYRNWVESRRDHVDELSNGRLGYVHIASMSQGALDQLVFDLDQENHSKDGVVVDVRNNNGGFVNVYAIDILARRNYFTMEGRASDVRAPSRVRLGQRALLAPTILVTNQHTLSDGEDFTEGYRSLELGSVVGEPTSGWIIFTGSRGLVDGTSVRMPGTEIRDLRGQNMELNPRPVDVEVVRPAGEWLRGRDSQLERAVEVLISQIDGR
ncbi:MAG: PDZ domain-containing protein [Gemmatimonadetes bacterium]|nr:PDZ domain-containing protein [Gemmatimonadota bacterium]